MKIVLDIKEKLNPKNNDIIVFDKDENCWKVMPKTIFLFEQNKKISALEKANKELKDELLKQENQIIEIAKIVKGEIE